MRILLGLILVTTLIGMAGFPSGTDFYRELTNKPEKSEKSQKETAEIEEEKPNRKESYEAIKENVNRVDPVPILDKLDPLMTKEAFTNKIGLQGWSDYKNLMDEVKLADSKYVKESEGSSIEEVDAFFKDKKGVQRKVMGPEVDGIKQVNYWYVDPSGKKQGKSKIPVFYAEILTKFKDDKLISASIEPGAFTVKTENEIKQSEFNKSETLNELLKIKNPKPISYSVIQMEYEGYPLTDVSLLTKDEDEEDSIDSAMLAYFTMSPVIYNEKKEHQILSMSGIPFMTASEDFGNSEYKAVQHFIKQMEDEGKSDMEESVSYQ